MGVIRHNGILVTGYEPDIQKVYKKAKKIFYRKMVSELSQELGNGYQSFAIFPDGSKEGWGTSNDNDENRETFFEWLEKKDRAVSAVDVAFGGDFNATQFEQVYF